MTSTRPRSVHLPAHFVRRPRLAEALSRPHARLVVVTGPAGSGKSLVVRDWSAASEVPTAWLPLEARHTDPEHFLEAILTALEQVAPGMLDATWRDDPADHAADRAIPRAVDHLAGSPPAALVLDDLHAIDRSPTTALLGRLVDVLPATNLRLVVCSRSDPPLPLHRFRLAGDLVELREADLRFRHAEATEFFARFPLVDLDHAQVARLVERTEGWAAGLQFAALSPAGRDDTNAFVERFAGSDRHVADFLLDEVLDRQPSTVRGFLLATSVLDRLCAGLCERVTGRPDANALLRRIESEHLFVVPLDDEREWFRYHHLFGQLLRRELRVAHPELERACHERAASWYVEHGDHARAIDHLLAAGDADGAFGQLVEHLRDHLATGRHETVRGWLHQFPADFVDSDAAHQLVFVLAFVRTGLLDRARAILEGHRAARSAAGAELHYVVAAAAVASVSGDPEQAIALGHAAWERRGEVDLAALPAQLGIAVRELWGYLPVGLARAHALLDDRAGVRRWAAVVRRQGPRLPADLVATIGAEAWAEARDLRLRSAAETAEQALALGTEYGRGTRRSMFVARLALASVHRERDQLDRAVDVLHPHLDAALREGQVAAATLAEVELARIDCARGRGDEALARLLRVRRDRGARGTPLFIETVLDVAECRLRLVLGDLDRAADLLADVPPGPERTLLEARAELVAGHPAEAASLLDELRAASHDRRRWVEATILSARALADCGDLAGARRLLGGVVDLARREGVTRSFLDEGFDSVDLVAAGGGQLRGEAARTRQAGLVEPLSDRELSVLRYLPSRLSNREIGAELYVSLNTVKSHLKTIYRKLDVERRDEAVRRARQLGLI